MKRFRNWIENCESLAVAELIAESAAIVSWERRIYTVLEIFSYGKSPSIKNFFSKLYIFANMSRLKQNKREIAASLCWVLNP